MKLPILLVLSAICVSIVFSYPKNYDAIPKDYYKRQILQPIPGYIPVYIKADGVPLIRTEKEKHEKTQKLIEPETQNEFRSSNKEEEPKTEEKVKEETPVKEIKNLENPSKLELSKGKDKLEKIKLLHTQGTDQKKI